MHRLWARDIVEPESGWENHRRQLEERRGVVSGCREKFWPGWSPSRAADTTEVAVAINCDSDGDDDDLVRYAIGLDDEGADEWKASQPDHFLTGSIDYFDPAGGPFGEPFVSDLKTGRYESKGFRDRGQLKVYSLAAYLITGETRVAGNVVLHPRYPKANAPTGLWGAFSGIELDAFHDVLRAEYRRHCALRLEKDRWARSAMPGDWCTFCPAREACPEYAIENHSVE